MNRQKCQAKDPASCRYHGTRNILHELQDQAANAANNGNAEQYLRLRARANIIEDTYAKAEAHSAAETARNNHINGETNENDITNSIRAANHAEYIIAQAFQDYNAETYAEKKEILEAQLVIQGNKTETQALFDLEGNRLPAKLVPVVNNYTGNKEYIWGIIEGNDPSGQIKEWFRPSQAKNEETARRNNERKGYYVGKVLAPAVIKKVTNSTIAGASTWPAIVSRWDTPFDSDQIENIDNGQPSKK